MLAVLGASKLDSLQPASPAMHMRFFLVLSFGVGLFTKVSHQILRLCYLPMMNEMLIEQSSPNSALEFLRTLV